jgi:hypothetical protein
MGGERADPTEVRVVKDMALSHADFFRILPALLENETYDIDGNNIRLARGTGEIEIRLSPECHRQMGMLRLPRTEVELRFRECSARVVEAFLAHFDLRYRRGGG